MGQSSTITKERLRVIHYKMGLPLNRLAITRNARHAGKAALGKNSSRACLCISETLSCSKELILHREVDSKLHYVLRKAECPGKRNKTLSRPAQGRKAGTKASKCPDLKEAKSVTSVDVGGRSRSSSRKHLHYTTTFHTDQEKKRYSLGEADTLQMIWRERDVKELRKMRQKQAAGVLRN